MLVRGCPTGVPVAAADGTAGGIDKDSITFDICRQLVDQWIAVSEVDIAQRSRAEAGRQRRCVQPGALLCPARSAIATMAEARLST